LVLRSRCDEWIIALPGCFNIYRQQSGRHHDREFLNSIFRQNFDEATPDALMNDLCGISATFRGRGNEEISVETRFRSRGGRGFQEALVISPVSGSAAAMASAAGCGSRRRLAFDCLSR
jgi:hypothetical protein